MPNPIYGNRMSTIGIHAMSSEEPIILGLNSAVSRCVDIRIELNDCAAFDGEKLLPKSGYIGQVRFRRYSYRGNQQWRVTVPNCEMEDYALKITCQTDMLRVDVNRKLHSKSISHGIVG